MVDTDEGLQTDVPGRVYAYMVLNAPTMGSKSELARYWILEGIKRDLSQRRRETKENLNLNEELVRALDTYQEHGEVEAEYNGE